MLLLYTLLSTLPLTQSPDTLRVHEIPPVTVSASLKHSSAFSEQPVAVSSFALSDFAPGSITEPKNLSLTVPNLMYADYGSKMTSSVYIRGIGARMDQPAMGLYMDYIPILNKNNYDNDYFDVQRIDVLRGPQGTLYGRNSIGGVMEVRTLSPLYYQGTRLRMEYGNGNSSAAQVSTYQKPRDNLAYSVSLNHRYSDGFFTNEYNGTAADRILSENGRIKVQARLSDRLTLENTLTVNYVKQTGFAYSLYDESTGRSVPINHNDPCNYRRFGLINGLVLSYYGDRFMLSSATSYQFMDDKMVLDQDFRPISMFTLQQSQRENAFTQEFVIRSTEDKKWQWTSGVFGFYKNVDMQAPVNFKKDGIDELILANANAGIHTRFPDADLLILEDDFLIGSDFGLPVYGVSAYHQSSVDAGRWTFTAGLRADYEHTSIRYANATAIHYRFSMTMPDFKPFGVDLSGRQSQSFFELMPKAAIMYETGAGKLYASVARGYKAGGFNTQIFSDILQNRMMNGMMEDLGVYFNGYEPAYDAETAISYKPEYSWNYELGGHFKLLDGHLFIDPALFWIECRDQQLTVFPPGQTTGRLMSNAGRSRSLGAELSVAYAYDDLRIEASYGYTHAKFISYLNGNEDYSGNRIPYAPLNTVSVNGSYNWMLKGKWLESIFFGIGWQGAGKIYWNETKSTAQPFYGLLNANVSFKKGNYSLGLWARNLTDTKFNTFYFRSVGHAFVQRGRPRQFGIFFNLTL